MGARAQTKQQNTAGEAERRVKIKLFVLPIKRVMAECPFVCEGSDLEDVGVGRAKR